MSKEERGAGPSRGKTTGTKGKAAEHRVPDTAEKDRKAPPGESPVLVAPDSHLVTRLHASPNIEPRKGGPRPRLVIQHYTGMASAEAAILLLADPAAKVSCHYVVDEHGAVTQMVAESLRAWHAGQSHWQGETDINSLSIGIEIQNPGHERGYPPFPEAQMQAVAALTRDICARHAIPPQGVLAHSDVAPARKIDPGERFDWAWLAREGVGHWVKPAPVREDDVGFGRGEEGRFIAEVQAMLRYYGYGIEITGIVDAETERVVSAFQRHFRRALVDGRIDRSTVTTLERLIAALPAVPVA